MIIVLFNYFPYVKENIAAQASASLDKNNMLVRFSAAACRG